jgi:hypothetical protein
MLHSVCRDLKGMLVKKLHPCCWTQAAKVPTSFVLRAIGLHNKAGLRHRVQLLAGGPPAGCTTTLTSLALLS